MSVWRPPRESYFVLLGDVGRSGGALFFSSVCQRFSCFVFVYTYVQKTLDPLNILVYNVLVYQVTPHLTICQFLSSFLFVPQYFTYLVVVA